ncbi:hypothetical protein TI39_contig428g00020 [Zymoseptoria brevis]|uniref:BTB domain-containing protein n=1 Tax=Zymoseptoria brevis TaxID=1047168 RepID=A0A0F4GL86_9PEZI|nr:hypothetical protein TI39_contig428g00020 [Zymoseptoria brevis]
MDIERYNSPSDSRNDDYAMCDSDGDSLPSPSEVIIDESGDAVVIAKTAGATRSFVVYSRAFALVCEPWNSMVKYRASMGANVSASTSRMEFTLEDDDWYALELVLRIAHLQFDKVPDSVSLGTLLQLSILTDKYQATQIVRPWITRWVVNSWDGVSGARKVQHIWIAWEYGLKDEFEQLVASLVLESETNAEGTVLIHEGKAMPDHMPPGLVESILNARASVFVKLHLSKKPTEKMTETATDVECRSMLDEIMREDMEVNPGLKPRPENAERILAAATQILDKRNQDIEELEQKKSVAVDELDSVNGQMMAMLNETDDSRREEFFLRQESAERKLSELRMQLEVATQARAYAQSAVRKVEDLLDHWPAYKTLKAEGA